MSSDPSTDQKRALDRGTFLVAGFVLAALKYNLDRLLAWTIADRYFTPLNYLHPFAFGGPTPEDVTAYGWIWVTAIPVVWVCVTLFVRRLRTIGVTPWLSALALVPAVNVVFFLLLSVIDATPDDADCLQFLPNSDGGAALAGALAPAFPALLATLAAIYGFEEYGFALFVAVPFCSGLGASLVYGARTRRARSKTVGVAMSSVVVLGIGLLVLAIEGVICLAMAAPIGLALAAVGGLVGHAVLEGVRRSGAMGSMLLVTLLAAPILMGAEWLDDSTPPLFEVTTTVEIDAPPEAVWEQVVTFGQLPEPEQFWFESGIAYPTHARIEGHGVGAVRHCEFNTGAFVEPIEVWDEPRHLAFRVEEQPPSMEEMSPWGEIDAPHVDDYLRSEKGEFRLTRLPGGRTRLEGTTWYRHEIWPAHYWRLWSDAIIGSIHTRVLRHIEVRAEQSAGQSPHTSSRNSSRPEPSR